MGILIIDLTPDSSFRWMVLEQIPLHASQNRISWSYDPVARITDMSCRGGAVLDALEGMVVAYNQ